MNHALIFLASLLGFACLAMAMPRHQLDALGHELPASASRALRGSGALLLLLALALAVRSMGWGLGLVNYSGHSGMAAGVVFMALLIDQRLRPPR
ncbi:DUF3325 domain-containing protein [Vandammella animalimorsus]|uniref:DUF3325 domain-containing protein n=1 Tax=Vandammella animalimorsus TaxID=2029117 RepID=UPI0031BBA96E